MKTYLHTYLFYLSYTSGGTEWSNWSNWSDWSFLIGTSFPREGNSIWFWGDCKGKWGFVKFLVNEPQMDADERGWGDGK